MSNAAKAFLAFVAPPIAVLIFTAISVWAGSMPFRALLAVASVWLIVMILAYGERRVRQSRRRVKRSSSGLIEARENRIPD